jgi:hypothetical protein
MTVMKKQVRGNNDHSKDRTTSIVRDALKKFSITQFFVRKVKHYVIPAKAVRTVAVDLVWFGK